MNDFWGVRKITSYIANNKNTSSFFASDVCVKSLDNTFIVGTEPKLEIEEEMGLVAFEHPAIDKIKIFIRKTIIEEMQGWATRKADAFRILGIEEKENQDKLMRSDGGK